MPNRLSFGKQALARWVNRLNPQSPPDLREWAIGVCEGTSPFDFGLPGNIKGPVLTCSAISDARATLVADPFMIQVDGRWHMFFELHNQSTGKGEIGLATSGDARDWRYERIVLAEPFHLSYPYVFEWHGDYYMVPESWQAREVRLYRARDFPWRWEQVGTLLPGAFALDPSLAYYNKKWWLFAETNPAHKYDTLRLFWAEDLLGSWTEHPKSPIVRENPHIARPGGRVLVHGDGLVRYAQDTCPAYGLQVRAFVITELGTSSYAEHESEKSPVLTGSGHGWNCSGMHHLDAHLLQDGKWLACVDGWSRDERHHD